MSYAGNHWTGAGGISSVFSFLFFRRPFLFLSISKISRNVSFVFVCFFNKPWRLKWKSRVEKIQEFYSSQQQQLVFSLETKISLELIQPCIESGPPKRSVSIRCGPFRQYVLWDSRRGLLCSTWLEFENIFFFFSVLIILLLHWAIAIGRVVGGGKRAVFFYTCPRGIPSSSQLVWAICCPVILSAVQRDHLEKTNNSHKATTYTAGRDYLVFFFLLLPPPLIFILCFHHSEMMDLLLLDASIGGVLQVSEK